MTNSPIIAIVSMACRFPSAPDVQSFWNLLMEGTATFRKVPPDRWRSADFPNSAGSGAFLDDIRRFDPAFFQISTAEANQMDPQQRICLELAWETMAGCGGAALYKGSSTATLVGVTHGTYGDILTQELLLKEQGDRFTTTGGLRNMVAARIAQVFDLQGTAFTIDTACSSALAALHLAVRMLEGHDCRQALVGGVHINATAASLLGMQSAGALSANPDTYRIFDERSDGFFLGEGAGFVLLKRLDDALADGDTVLALLPGIAINNDGHAVSVMSPRPKTQRDVIAAAYERAGLDRSKVAYIETHGTGTPLGDAVEIRSLSQVFGDGKKRYIGTAKANIGHLLSAAGMAGLIKTILCLLHRKVPPHIHCEQERKNLQLHKNHWIIPHQTMVLDQPETLLMGVNSFGFGGTNAHVVLEEYPDHKDLQKDFRQQVPDYQKIDCWLTPLTETSPISTTPPPVYLPRFQPFVFPEKTQPADNESLLVSWKTMTNLPEDAVLVNSSQYLKELPKAVFLLFPTDWLALHQWMSAHRHLFSPEHYLWVITSRAVQTNNTATDWNSTNTALTAFCKAAGDELICPVTQVDVSAVDDLSDVYPHLQGQHLIEIPLLIYRNGNWQRPVWERHILGNTSEPASFSGKICLITGGSGSIGTAVAGVLLKYGATVILNGRSAASDTNRWNNLLKINNLPKSTLHYFPADCGDAAAVQEMMERISREFGQLDMVFHAAGVVKPTAWAKLNGEHLTTILQPKLNGLQHLDRATQSTGFHQVRWVLFSSIAATLPGAGAGLSGYAMANSMMDQYAVYMRNQGQQVLSIAWGPWAGEGMSHWSVFQEKLAENGIYSLPQQEGLDTLINLLQMPEIEAAMVLRHKGDPLPGRIFQEKKQGTVKTISPPETAAILPAHFDLVVFLRTMLAEVLEIPEKEIEMDTSLLDLGLDSLNAMDLSSRLELAGFRNIPFDLFFEHQTLGAIIAFLQKQQASPSPTPPASSSDILPLSNLQQAFLKGHFLTQSPTFSMLRQTIEGDVQMPVFEQAVKGLFSRHPMLRAQVVRVRKDNEFQFELPLLTPENATAKWTVEIIPGHLSLPEAENSFVNRRFDLEHDIPFRVGWHADKGQTHIFLLMHHAFTDGWSMLLLAQEIWQAYEKIVSGEDEIRPVTDLEQIWQKAALRKPDDIVMQWWQAYTQNYPGKDMSPHLTEMFSLDRPWMSAPSAVFPLEIMPETATAIARKAQKTGISLQALYFSAFRQSLSAWTLEPNMIINCAVAGRHTVYGSAVYQTVGCFADAYPFYSPEKDMAEVARDFEKWYQKISHAPGLDSPTVTKWMQEKQLQQPVAGFSFVKFPIDWAKNLRQIQIKSAAVRGFTFQTRFTLHCWEDPQGLKIAVNYPQDLFPEKDLKRFQECFSAALTMVAGIDTPPLPSPEVVKKGNPVLEAIRQQSRLQPDKIALQTDSKKWHYTALLEASAQLAGGLLQKGIQPGNVLAWWGGHSAETVIAMLAAMRLGCTWVPVDRHLPLERAESIIQQAGANMILTESDADLSPNWSIPHFSFTSIRQSAAFADINIEVAPAHISYIIFTSGSSGQPKGVPITVASLHNYLDWCVPAFGYCTNDRFLLTASIGFDASMRQILAPLLIGAELHILPPDVLRQPNWLLTALQERGISIWSSVPSLWEVLIAAMESSKLKIRPPLRIVHVGGERLETDLVVRWQKLYQNKAVIFNLYGPTETTINATFFKIDRIWSSDEEIPIGSAAAGGVLQVVDEQGEESNEGELWIGGPGISPGYLNSANDRFIQQKGQHFYKSGDQVRRSPNGLLYFIGRIDRQMKWRGYRIEPGEIEHRILQIPGVKKAWVTLLSHQGTPVLAGAVVTENTVSVIETILRNELPAYMIPGRWFEFSSFPLLENGKTDTRKLLETMELQITQGNGQDEPKGECLSPQEQQMAEIWAAILRRPVERRDTHFFYEGGDSISAMLLFAALEDNGWTALPPIEVLYTHPTLGGFTQALGKKPAHGNIVALLKTPTATPDFLPLTDAQTGFVLASRNSGAQQHLWRAMIPLKGPLDLICFQQAMEAVIERHPALRGKLEKRGGVSVFKIIPASETPVTLFGSTPDWSSLKPAAQAQLLATFLEKTGAPDFLKTTDFPLLRSTLIQKSAQDFIWHISVHHLLADGLSQQVFFRDFWTAYTRIRQKEVPFPAPLRSTIADYVAKIQDHRKATADNALDYWTAIWEKPYIFPKMDEYPDGHGFMYETRQLPKKPLDAAAQQAGISPFSLVLYTYYQTLAEWLQQEDLVIGIAQHGRDAGIPDMLNLFGNFTYATPVRPENGADLLKNIQNLAFQVRQTATFRIDVMALRKRLGYAVDPGQLLGSTFFMTWLPETVLPELPDGIAIDWQQTDTNFQPSEQETAVMLTVKPGNPDESTLTLAFNRRYFKEREAALFAEKMLEKGQQHVRCLSPKKTVQITHVPFSTDKTPPLDAALIAYLPSLQHIKHLSATTGLGQTSALSNTIKQQIFGDLPCLWTEVQETAWGRTGVFLLPYWPEEITPDKGVELTLAIRKAANMAATAGARCISLAGMLPAATVYGTLLKPLMENGPVKVTTGHSTTVAAVIKTLLRAVHSGQMPVDPVRMACVGLGSIGQAVLRTYLTIAPHPESILLCDIKGKEGFLSGFAEVLRTTHGVQCPIHIQTGPEGLQQQLQAYNLIVGAAFGGEIVDIDQLSPGTILVDDSFPPCFNEKKALQRMQTTHDILVTGGGLLAMPGAEKTLYLPEGLAVFAELLSAAVLPETMASCQLESLLLARFPELPPTFGLASYQQVLLYLERMEAVEAAGFHVDGKFL